MVRNIDYKFLRRIDISLIFRTVRSEAIPVATQNHESTVLFNPTDFPVRIILGLMETSRFNGKYDKECFKFSRVFTTTDSFNFQQINRNLGRGMPNMQQQNSPQRGVMDFLRRWFLEAPEGELGDGAICRPPQYHAEVPLQQVGSTTSVFVERCQLLINGKSTNSMDMMKMTASQAPEQYLTFMR